MTSTKAKPPGQTGQVRSSPLSASGLSTLAAEKKDKDKDKLDSLLEMLQLSRNEASERHQETEKELTQLRTELNQKIDNLDTTMVKLQSQVNTNTEDIKTMKEDVAKVVEESKQDREERRRLQQQYTQVEDASLRWELDQSAYCFRVQNLPEHGKKGDLKTYFVTWLTSILGGEEEQFDQVYKGIERIYRTNIRRARHLNRVPEVMVKFCCKNLRNSLFERLREKDRHLGESEILFLKDVPFKVRVLRRDYAELAELLRRNGTAYSWLLPVRLIFTYKNKTHRIVTLERLQDFLQQYGDELKANAGEESRDQQVPPMPVDVRRRPPRFDVNYDVKKKEKRQKKKGIYSRGGVIPPLEGEEELCGEMSQEQILKLIQEIEEEEQEANQAEDELSLAGAVGGVRALPQRITRSKSKAIVRALEKLRALTEREENPNTEVEDNDGADG